MLLTKQSGQRKQKRLQMLVLKGKSNGRFIHWCKVQLETRSPSPGASISHVSLSIFLFLENNGGFWFARIFLTANQNKVIVLRHAQCHALVFQLTSTKSIKLMAESVDIKSSEGSESSDYDEISSSELSTSCENSKEEERCSRGKGKGPARTEKNTSKGNASSTQSAQSASSRKKRKVGRSPNTHSQRDQTNLMCRRRITKSTIMHLLDPNSAKWEWHW